LYIVCTIYNIARNDDKEKMPEGSAQPIEKADSGEANPRKSKLFPWRNLAGAWAGLAGFGKIWS
jgi:hypothetical protein